MAQAVDGDALLRLAHRALYLAKKLGRNRLERATADDLPSLQGATTQRRRRAWQHPAR
jgi:hypothetical protein